MEPHNSCAFCRITAGSSPARKVYEENSVVAFLDTRPLFPGHVLVVPRDHIATLTDASPESVAVVFQAAHLISQAVESALRCEGTFVAVNNKVSQSVPHFHVHVVPRNKGDGLRGFFWPRNNYDSDEHADQVQQDIQRAARSLSAK